MNKIQKYNKLIILMVVSSLFLGVLIPISNAGGGVTINGYDKGPSYTSVIPIKKVTFVNFDKEGYLDDYALLAAVPTSVFRDENQLFSNPLLFFQPMNTYPNEDRYRFLNDYSGTKYLMDDWMNVCNGKLDKLTTINVDENDIDPDWEARLFKSINSEDIFEIASQLALDEWSYTDEAVVAVIKEKFEQPENTEINKEITGELSGNIGEERITIKRPFGPASEYEYFTVSDEYKYIKVVLWYPSFVWHSKLLNLVPGFSGAGITLPSVDPDIQVYCKYDGDWVQTSAASEMAITKGPIEHCFSYTYNSSDWRVAVTNMPTKGESEGFIRTGPFGKLTTYGTFKEALKNLIYGVDHFYVDITKYPGVEVEIPDKPPFGCRDTSFKLTWSNKNIKLGLTIIGPSGEELDSVLNEETDYQEIKFHQLGECLEGEHYKAVVYALDDVSTPVDFKIEYSWQQNITKKQADMIASACEGAVLGSTINAPLLYVKSDEAPKVTVDTLNTLGVKKIHLVDLGGYLSKDVIKELSNSADISKHYKEYKDVYNAITDITDSYDVVFSTIDPWSYWYYTDKPGELKPAGEFAGAFHFGPATYAAAHHGTPLLLVDNHPELSSAVTWHVDFWHKHAQGNILPPIAPMYLTGTRVYDFLEEYGFDKEGAESILTVADQYDIGPTWTRVFAGLANPGGIIGTPVDESNHINRCIFYPCLIYENPALQGPVTLINGSKSERVQSSILHPFKTLFARLSSSTPGLSNLKILRESGPEEFIYPVLNTYGCYSYRFNERGGKYWGATYKTRTGYTPGEDISANDIDEGVMLKYTGKAGAFLPDLDESKNTAFYEEKAGYSSAFSTNFDITMKNLNSGVISWYMTLHGAQLMGGRLAWWEPMSTAFVTENGLPEKLAKILSNLIGMPLGANPVEINPWRGYDMFWGSTEEPDSATLDSELGLILGWLGLADRNGPLNGGIIKPGLDFLPSNTPLLKLLGKSDDYHDGLIGPYSLTALLVKFHYSHSAIEVDDKLENLHSMNFHAGSCLIGTRYFQIAFMRHGSVLQEADPWPTSYWAGYAGQQVPREFALGKTAGEAYAEGITTIGIKYIFEENEERVWWWDNAENIVLFTDPDLRIWVPSTEYSSENHWEKPESLTYSEDFIVDGHTPFGATSHPREKTPVSFFEKYLLLIIIAIILIIIICTVVVKTKKTTKKKK